MDDKKITVPAGMLEAFFDEAHDGPRWSEEEVTHMLAAALRWLSENPIVPSTTEVMDCWREGLVMENPIGWNVQRLREQFCGAIDWWQRRMFLASNSKIPEAIKDLILPNIESGFFKPEILNERLIEAYRRGQKSGAVCAK